jgi:phosphoribosyl-AMP cyclohydrolase
MPNTADNNNLSQLFNKLSFTDDGLIPAITQQYDSREVLMMAWMNEESIRETLNTGRVCYYSRSREKLWRKGETSGQTQTLKNFRIDCDSDTILLLVDQKGVACHTGRRSCFFEEVNSKGTLKIVADALKKPEDLFPVKK